MTKKPERVTTSLPVEVEGLEAKAVIRLSAQPDERLLSFDDYKIEEVELILPTRYKDHTIEVPIAVGALESMIELLKKTIKECDDIE